jgi:hypothetical protein
MYYCMRVFPFDPMQDKKTCMYALQVIRRHASRMGGMAARSRSTRRWTTRRREMCYWHMRCVVHVCDHTRVCQLRYHCLNHEWVDERPSAPSGAGFPSEGRGAGLHGYAPSNMFKQLLGPMIKRAD